MNCKLQVEAYSKTPLKEEPHVGHLVYFSQSDSALGWLLQDSHQLHYLYLEILHPTVSMNLIAYSSLVSHCTRGPIIVARPGPVFMRSHTPTERSSLF